MGRNGHLHPARKYFHDGRFGSRSNAATVGSLPALDEEELEDTVDEAEDEEEDAELGVSSPRRGLNRDETTCSSFLGRKENDRAPRRRWKEWEDKLLIEVVAREGPSRWNDIAKSFPGRNGRQVRLRWMNHLQPSLEKAPWRPEEDEMLLAAHASLGNKWAQIASELGGRTDNAVKNRFKSLQRRSNREQRGNRNAFRQGR
jgi:hypothetical protein